MLTDNPQSAECVFPNTELLIAVHCENETTINNNSEKYKLMYHNNVLATIHYLIRSEKTYYTSSKTVDWQKKQVYVFMFFTYLLNEKRNCSQIKFTWN